MKQVYADHYLFQAYMSLAHWGSYWKQLETVLAYEPKRVLVVGVGDGVVPKYLADQGLAVDTLDFDPGLKPTIVGDVRTIAFKGNAKYDLVLCCQVLEHLPFQDFEVALLNLLNASSRLIISLPYSHVLLARLEFRFPVFGHAKLLLAVPRFWKKWRFDGQHYWELGTRGFGITHFRRRLGQRCRILNEFSAFANPYHRFYVLTTLDNPSSQSHTRASLF
jgi:hypothetical protein